MATTFRHNVCLHRLAYLFAFMAVLAVTLWAYWPALYHGARGDQLSFLAEYSGCSNKAEILLRSLDYNRSREFVVGDRLLFRPLLYLILSLQLVIFGYRFWLWQAVGLASHLFVVWALWRLLRRWGGEAAALVFTLFFALLFAQAEAVIWHGITPYVMFAGLVLLALERLDTYLFSMPRNNSRLAVAVVLMTAAVFIYEAGIWYLVLFSAYGWWAGDDPGKRRSAVWFLFPLGLYIAASVGHALLTRLVLDSGSTSIPGHILSLQTPENLAKLWKWFTVGGLFLGAGDIFPVSRLIVNLQLMDWSWPWGEWHLAHWTGLGVSVAVLVAAFCPGRQPRRQDLGRVALLVMMLCGYLGLITAGRMNVRSDGTGPASCLYYFYNFWVLAVPLLILAVRHVFIWRFPQALAAVVLSAALVAAAGQNARELRRMNQDIARSHASFIKMIGDFDGFIAAHRGEADFSFAVEGRAPGNNALNWLKRASDPQGRTYSLVEALYRRYYKADKPKYLIRLSSP